jgi:mono/diheme cytochrome c family protein
MKHLRVLLALSVSGGIALPAFAQSAGISPKQAEVMKQLLATYEAKAKEEAADKKSKAGQFKPFSAQAGRELYLKRRTWQATDPTCSNCHTEDPAKPGTHSDTKKPIKPLAPSANPERFTDIAKVEKNFTEHCVDLLGRNCEAGEKGHLIAYLMSVK